MRRDLRPYLFSAIFGREGTLVVEDGKIRAKADPPVTEEELERIRRYKAQILEVWDHMTAAVEEDGEPWPVDAEREAIQNEHLSDGRRVIVDTANKQ